MSVKAPELNPQERVSVEEPIPEVEAGELSARWPRRTERTPRERFIELILQMTDDQVEEWLAEIEEELDDLDAIADARAKGEETLSLEELKAELGL